MDLDKITDIEGLGRSAKLGELYDWTTNRFTGQSFISNGLPEKFIRSIDMHAMDSNQIIHQDSSYESKFKLFDINSFDTQLSLLSSTFPFAGSSKFFTHSVTNKKTIHRFWTFYKQKVYKNVLLNIDKVLAQQVDNTTLLNSNVTHFVYGVYYGIRAVMSIETKDTINQTKHHQYFVEEVLRIIIKETIYNLPLNKTKYDDMENYIKYNYYSDYTDIDEPNNLYEAVQQLRQSFFILKIKDESKLKPLKGLIIGKYLSKNNFSLTS